MGFDLNKNRISKYYRLSSLRQTEREEKYANEDKCWESKIPVVTPAYLFGLELEIENVKAEPYAHYASYWTITADNSLRNNGVEFVSCPLRMSQIEKALRQLNYKMNPDIDFSPRTSTHVHMNVRDLTISEIQALVLVYTTIEEVLFKWVGHNRDNNIFCIKITDTEYINLMKSLHENFDSCISNWNKYTALNLHPIADKGTVEFRHLYGTNDIPTILAWVNMLACIKNYVKTYPLNTIMNIICDLNSNSQYEIFLFNIFGEYINNFELTNPRMVLELMEKNVTYIKLALLNRKTEAEPGEYTEVFEEVPIAIDTPRIPTIRAYNPFRIPPVPPTPMNLAGTDPVLTINEMIDEFQRQQRATAREQMARTAREILNRNTTVTPVEGTTGTTINYNTGRIL